MSETIPHEKQKFSIATPNNHETEQQEHLVTLINQLYFGPIHLIQDLLLKINSFCVENQQDAYQAWENYQLQSESEYRFFFYREERVWLIAFAIKNIGTANLQSLIKQTTNFLSTAPSVYNDHWRVFTQPLFEAVLMCANTPELLNASKLAWSQEQMSPSKMFKGVRMAAAYQGIDSACQHLLTELNLQYSQFTEPLLFILAKSQSAEARHQAANCLDSHLSDILFLKEKFLAHLLVQEPETTQPQVFQIASDYLQTISHDQTQNDGAGIQETPTQPEIFLAVALSLSLSRKAEAKKLLLTTIQTLNNMSYIPELGWIVVNSLVAVVDDWEITKEILLYSLASERWQQLAKQATLGLIITGVSPEDDHWNDLKTAAYERGMQSQWQEMELFYLFMISAYDRSIVVPIESISDHLDHILIRQISGIGSADTFKYWLEESSLDSQSKEIAFPKIVEAVCDSIIRCNQHLALSLDFLRLTKIPNYLKLQVRRALFICASKVPSRKQKLAVYNTIVEYAAKSGDHEAIVIMVNQLKNNFNNDANAEEIYFLLVPLLESTARYAQSALKALFLNDKDNGPISKRILKSYFSNGMYDPQIANLGSETEVMNAVKSLLTLGYEPVCCLVQDIIQQRDPQIRVTEYKQKKQTLTLWQILKNPDYCQLEFALTDREPRYSNLLTWDKYKSIIDGALHADDTSAPVVRFSLVSQWQRQSRIKNNNQSVFQQIFDEGIGTREVIPTLAKTPIDAEKAAHEEYATQQITELFRLSLPILLLDALIGRIDGIIKRLPSNIGNSFEQLSDQLQAILTTIDREIGTGANAFDLFEQLYGKVWQFYTTIITNNPNLFNNFNHLSAKEMMDEDRKKLEASLTSKSFTASEQALSLLKMLDKAVARISKHGNFDRLVNTATDIGRGLTAISSSTQGGGTPRVSNHSYRIEFVPKKAIRRSIRVGDAQESCIANNGANAWSISGYLVNSPTQAVIIVDQQTNLAVGHCMIHLAEVEANGQHVIRPIINGRYLANSVPNELGDAVIQYWIDWAQSAGLDPPILAKDPYGDHPAPPGWRLEKLKIRVLQEVKCNSGYSTEPSNLYYDFDAPINNFEDVEVYVS